MPQNPEGPSCLSSLGSTSNIAAFMSIPQTHTTAPQRSKETRRDLLMKQLKLQTSLGVGELSARNIETLISALFCLISHHYRFTLRTGRDASQTCTCVCLCDSLFMCLCVYVCVSFDLCVNLVCLFIAVYQYLSLSLCVYVCVCVSLCVHTSMYE